MSEELLDNQTSSPTPGAAIGSFIVIAILIAGAVYTLGGQFTKKTASVPPPESETVSTTTIATTTP